jgi:predicted transposase YdaD
MRLLLLRKQSKKWLRKGAKGKVEGGAEWGIKGLEKADRNMLVEGFSVEKSIEITGLSVETIEKLKT